MDGLLFTLCIILAVINLILTVILLVLKKKRRCLGKLIINMSDPEKDIYRVALNDLQDLEKEKIVYLKIEIEDDAQK